MPDTGPDSAPVVVAYDGSPSAVAALQQTGRLFPARRATILVVWKPVGAVLRASLAGMPREYVSEALEEVNEQVVAQATRLAS